MEEEFYYKRKNKYLKKGESIEVVWLTNSMEPPISQVMSETPTSGHPFLMRS